ncbi:MAG: hypothetical protein Q8R36_03755, partial [bacterium]|nr:hypothetical protein [bacterium]
MATQCYTMSRKRILVVGITLIIILFAFIFFQRNNYHAVVLYENGFHPKNISILIGETVYFSTERREPFLIESVILKPETTSTYPIDPKYREFKSTRPITYKSPWSFTFEREGIWHYQDLLNPQYAGIIFVFSEAANLQEHKDIEQYIIELCGTEGDAQINNCLEKVITRKAQDKNTESAFQIFEYLYHTDKDFRYNCS